MAENRVDIKIYGSADFKNVESELTNLKKKIAEVSAAASSMSSININTQSVAAAEKNFLSAVSSIKGMRVEMANVTDAAAHLNERILRNNRTFGEMVTTWRAGTRNMSQDMKMVGEYQAKLNQSMVVPSSVLNGQAAVVTNLGGMADKTMAASYAAKAYNSEMRSLGNNIVNTGKNMQWAGRQLTVGFTVPMVAFGTAIAANFLKVDEAMRKLMMVYGVGGAAGKGYSNILPSPQELEKVRAGVQQVSQEMAGLYGQSAAVTANIAADLAAAGYTQQQLLDLTKVATNAMVLGQTDQQSAVKATISIQNAYRLSMGQTTEALQFFSAAQAATSTTMNDLIDAVPRVGPIIKNLGGSYKDTVALLVAMKEGGVAAGEGANALKNSMQRIVSPTQAAQKTLQNFGINLNEIARSGSPIVMIEKLQSGLAKLDTVSRQQAITELFGKFQAARMTALLDNFNRSGTQSAKVMQMMSLSADELQKIQQRQIDTLQQSPSMRFQAAIESLKTSLVPLGQKLIEMVTPLINGLSWITKALQNIGPIKYLLAGGLGLTAIVGPLIMLGGLFANLVGQIFKMGQTFRMFRQGFSEGGGLSKPFTAIKEGIRGTQNYLEDFDASVYASKKATDQLTMSAEEQKLAFNELASALARYRQELEGIITLGGGPGGGPGPLGGGAGSYPRFPIGGPMSPTGIIGAATMPQQVQSVNLQVAGGRGGLSVNGEKIAVFSHMRPSGETIGGSNVLDIPGMSKTSNAMGGMAVVPGYMATSKFGKLFNEKLGENAIPIVPPSANTEENARVILKSLGFDKMTTGMVKQFMSEFSLENLGSVEVGKMAQLEGLRRVQQIPGAYEEFLSMGGKAGGRGGTSSVEIEQFFASKLGPEWEKIKSDSARQILSFYEQSQMQVRQAIQDQRIAPPASLREELSLTSSRFSEMLSEQYLAIVNTYSQEAAAAIRTGSTETLKINEAMKRNKLPGLINAGAAAAEMSGALLASVQDLIQKATGIMSSTTSAIQRAGSSIIAVEPAATVGSKIGKIKQTAMGLRATPLAGGGKVRGPGGPKDDLIPAMLSHGEYVVNADAVGHYGSGFMDAINSRKFANGGIAHLRRGSFVSMWDTLANDLSSMFNLVGGVRKTGTRSSRAVSEMGALPYSTFSRRNLNTRDKSRIAGWTENDYLRAGIPMGHEVVGHIYPPSFYERFGSPMGGSAPRLAGSSPLLAGLLGKPLNAGTSYDILPSQYVTIDKIFNESVARGQATGKMWLESGRTPDHFISLIKGLVDRGVEPAVARQIAAGALKRINAEMALNPEKKFGEAKFGRIVTEKTLAAVRSNATLLADGGVVGDVRGHHATHLDDAINIISGGAKAVGGGQEGTGFYTGTNYKNIYGLYGGTNKVVLSGHAINPKIYDMSPEERIIMDQDIRQFDRLSEKLRAEGYTGIRIPFGQQGAGRGGSMIKYIQDNAFVPTHLTYSVIDPATGRALIRRVNLDEIRGLPQSEVFARLGIDSQRAKEMVRSQRNMPDYLPKPEPLPKFTPIKPVPGRGVVVVASGGSISGPGGPKSDSIPAMLSNGEYVINADAVSHYGSGFMDAVNAKKLASGGIVHASKGWKGELDPQARMAQTAQSVRATMNSPAAQTLQSLSRASEGVSRTFSGMSTAFKETGGIWSRTLNGMGINMRSVGNVSASLATQMHSLRNGATNFGKGLSDYGSRFANLRRIMETTPKPQTTMRAMPSGPGLGTRFKDFWMSDRGEGKGSRLRAGFRPGMGSMMGGTALSMIGSEAGAAMEQNGGQTAMSTALQYAGTGAMIGSMAGPVGMIAGTIGGAAMGAIVGKNAQSQKELTDAMEKAHQTAMGLSGQFKASGEAMQAFGLTLKETSGVKLGTGAEEASAYAQAINQLSDAMRTSEDTTTQATINLLKTSDAQTQQNILTNQYLSIIAAKGTREQAAINVAAMAKTAGVEGFTTQNIINEQNKKFSKMSTSQKQVSAFAGLLPTGSRTIAPSAVGTTYDRSVEAAGANMGFQSALLKTVGPVANAMASVFDPLRGGQYKVNDILASLKYKGPAGMPEGFKIGDMIDYIANKSSTEVVQNRTAKELLSSGDVNLTGLAKLSGVTETMTNDEALAKIEDYMYLVQGFGREIRGTAQAAQDAKDQFITGFSDPIKKAVLNLDPKGFTTFMDNLKKTPESAINLKRTLDGLDENWTSIVDTVAGSVDPSLSNLVEKLFALGQAGNITAGNLLNALNSISSLQSTGFSFNSQMALQSAVISAAQNTRVRSGIEAQAAFRQTQQDISGKYASKARSAATQSAGGDSRAQQRAAEDAYNAQQKAIQGQIDGIQKEKDARQKLYDMKQKQIEQDRTMYDLQNNINKARNSGDLLALASAQNQYNNELNKQNAEKAKQIADEADQKKIDDLQKKLQDLQDAYNKQMRAMQDSQSAAQGAANQTGEANAGKVQKAWDAISKQFQDHLTDPKFNASTDKVIQENRKIISNLTGETYTAIDSSINELKVKWQEWTKNPITIDGQGMLTDVKYPDVKFIILADGTLSATGNPNNFKSVAADVGSKLSGASQALAETSGGRHIEGEKRANQPRKASGGHISGPGTDTSDSIPAYLSNGEYVVKASSVRQYGTGFMDAINAGRYANGGLINRFAKGSPGGVSISPDAIERMGTDGDPKTASPASSNASGGPNNAASAEQAAAQVVKLARQYAWVPYSFRVPGLPDQGGWGCATSAYWLYKQIGVRLPSDSLSQDDYDNLPNKVPKGFEKPADLLFFHNDWAPNRNINHVAVYLGNGEIFNGGNGIGGINWSKWRGTRRVLDDGTRYTITDAATMAAEMAGKAGAVPTVASMGESGRKKILSALKYTWSGAKKAAANTPSGKINAIKNLRGFAEGGSIFGPGGPTDDIIPALLSNGEFVVNAGATNKYGLQMLEAINNGTLNPAFAKPMARGGQVSSRDFNSNNASNSNVEYNINVNVEGTNASPEQIANTVMRTLKQREMANTTHRRIG